MRGRGLFHGVRRHDRRNIQECVRRCSRSSTNSISTRSRPRSSTPHPASKFLSNVALPPTPFGTSTMPCDAAIEDAFEDYHWTMNRAWRALKQALRERRKAMGKRSSFPRRERDNYPTPLSAVLPLLECLPPHTKFYEPCRGENDLVGHLTAAGHVLVGSSDEELDARTTQYRIHRYADLRFEHQNR